MDSCTPLPEHLKIFELSNELPDPMEELCRIGDRYKEKTGLTGEEAAREILTKVRDNLPPLTEDSTLEELFAWGAAVARKAGITREKSREILRRVREGRLTRNERRAYEEMRKHMGWS